MTSVASATLDSRKYYTSNESFLKIFYYSDLLCTNEYFKLKNLTEFLDIDIDIEQKRCLESVYHYNATAAERNEVIWVEAD